MAKRKAKKYVGMRMSDGMRDKYAGLFIEALESMEKAEWTKPWAVPLRHQPANVYRKNKPYRGVNMFLLSMLMTLKGWTCPYFITKRQMLNENGNYKYDYLKATATLALDDNGCAIIDDKGMPTMNYERRFPVFMFKPNFRDDDGNKIEAEEYDKLPPEEQEKYHRYYVQRNYYVYNLEQLNFKELYPEDYKLFTEVPEHDYERGTIDEVLEKMIMMGGWRCPIRWGGSSACYIPNEDIIRLPDRSKFFGDSVFYATAIHEMIHSTGPELGRNVRNIFASKEYAYEEFVAELSAACCCSMLGIGKLLDKNHIAYVDNWRHAIHEDKNFIPLVIDEVKRAVNYFFARYNEIAKEVEMPLLLAA